MGARWRCDKDAVQTQQGQHHRGTQCLGLREGQQCMKEGKEGKGGPSARLQLICGVVTTDGNGVTLVRAHALWHDDFQSGGPCICVFNDTQSRLDLLNNKHHIYI